VTTLKVLFKYWLETRIVEFLDRYNTVFGLISAQQASKTGLRKVKFHVPKHASFYICRYSSSNNFFDGSLEITLLKSTVAEGTNKDYQ
jgi:hypothetical protein